MFCRPRCIGFARRRIGRGGRIVLDRVSTNMDDVWSNFTIYDSAITQEQQQHQLQLKHQKQHDEEDSVVGDLVSVKSEKPDNIGSVVVDLVTHRVGRMNSVDSVPRTNSLSWSENIVINSEQSNHPTVVSIKQESLDDCLGTTTMTTAAVVQTPPPSLSNYHRYSANTMPATTTTPASPLRRTLSQNIPYNSINNSNKQNVSSSSGSNSYSCSSNLSRHHQLDRSASMPVTTIIKIEPMDGIETGDGGACGSVNDPTTTYPPTVKVDDDPYAEFLSEIRRDWLHFRPKTPPTPLSLEGENEPSDFGEPTVQFSERTPLQIELQRLAEQPNSMLLNGYDDNGSDLLMQSANDENVFVTGPFTLDDLMDDQQNQTNAMTTHDSLSSGGGNDINLSGDSLPELCLSLGESDENEKMLENILQECEFDDLKTFNTNANFWNGILEDACDDIDDPVNKKSAFDKLAAADFITTTDRNHKVGKRKSQHSKATARSGCSAFSISNIPKDDFFKKEDPPPLLSATEEGTVPTAVASIQLAQPPALVVTTAAIDDSSRTHQLITTPHSTTHIKIEPPDDILETVKLTRPQQQHQQILLNPANVIKTEVVQTTNIPPTVYASSTAVQQANAIIMQQMQHQQQQQELQKLQQQAQQVQKTFVIQQQQQILQQQQPHQTVQLQHQQPGEGTLILSNTASPIRRTTNGPAEKNSKSTLLLNLQKHCEEILHRVIENRKTFENWLRIRAADFNP